VPVFIHIFALSAKENDLSGEGNYQGGGSIMEEHVRGGNDQGDVLYSFGGEWGWLTTVSARQNTGRQLAVSDHARDVPRKNLIPAGYTPPRRNSPIFGNLDLRLR